jgi:hypothetical protein
MYEREYPRPLLGFPPDRCVASTPVEQSIAQYRYEDTAEVDRKWFGTFMYFRMRIQEIETGRVLAERHRSWYAGDDVARLLVKLGYLERPSRACGPDLLRVNEVLIPVAR